jgi:hypothetical protein
MLLHALKNLLHCVEHNSWIRLLSQHGKRLSRSSLAISEYCRVIPFQNTFAQKLSGVFEYLLLRTHLIKCKVKCVLFLFGSVLA